MSQKVFDLKSVMTFGKYKGHLLETVIQSDPQYIKWCVTNIGWFEMDEGSEKLLANTPEPHRSRSVYPSSYEGNYNFDDRSYAEKRADWPGGDDDYNDDPFPYGCDIYGFG